MRRPGVEQTARALRTSYVNGNYFTTLGVPAFGGRVFTPADDTAAAPPVVVMSHHAWQGTYGGDPKIVGATLVLEGQSVHRRRRHRRRASSARRCAAIRPTCGFRCSRSR